MTGRPGSRLLPLLALLLGNLAGVAAAGGVATPARAPLPPPGEMARMKALIEQGELGAARAGLESIVAAHPDWGRATLLLAVVEFRENRFERARVLFERAATLDPEELSGRLYLGWTLFYLGELDAAERSIRAFLEAHPDHAEARYALGRIELERGDVALAIRSLERAAELAAVDRDAVVEGRARSRLGEIHAGLDDLRRARTELEHAAELLPEASEVQYQLSRVLERSGDTAGAAAARQRSEALRETQAARRD
jgi:tetratricopeptide (TPR) repeat protein